MLFLFLQHNYGIFSTGLMMDSLFGRVKDIQRILTFLALQQSQKPKLFQRRCEIAVTMRQEIAAIFFISLPRVIQCLRAMFINVIHAPAEDCPDELILYVKQCSIQFYESIPFAHTVEASSHADLSWPAC